MILAPRWMLQDVKETMIVPRWGSAWSRMSDRFTKKLATVGISARVLLDRPLPIPGEGIFRLAHDFFGRCRLDNSQTPDLVTIADAILLQTRLHLMSILAAHIAVIYGTVFHDVVISTISIVAFAHMSGMTSRLMRAIHKTSSWLMRKADTRTGRPRSDQYSSNRSRKMKDRLDPSLAMSPPRSVKSRISSQKHSCRQPTPQIMLKTRMVPLFLFCSTALELSKAAPIISREPAVACKISTGDLSNDCPTGTSASLTPDAQALIASCVLTALVVFLVVVFGVPSVCKDAALVVWKRIFSWFRHFSLPQPLRSEDQDQGDGRNIPTPDVPNERDEVILRMGAVFESVTMERPQELQDFDLIHSLQDHGHGLEELP